MAATRRHCCLLQEHQRAEMALARVAVLEQQAATAAQTAALAKQRIQELESRLPEDA